MVGCDRREVLVRRASTACLGRLDHSDWRHEAIAAARDRGNETWRLCRVVQHLAQRTDSHAYHAITHSGLGPDSVEQLVFGHQAIRVRHQVVQHGENFRRQGDSLRRAPQAGVLRVKPEVSKDPL
jgi:hypothetical protein